MALDNTVYYCFCALPAAGVMNCRESRRQLCTVYANLHGFN